MALQRAFCKTFKLKRHDSVLSSATISKWLRAFWETSAVTSVKMVGKKKGAQTVKKCKKLRTAVEATPQTSLR